MHCNLNIFILLLFITFFFSENGALDSIQKRLLNETYDYQNDNTLILQVSTQAICNIITGNPSAIDFAWKEWMTDQSKGRIWW